MLLDYMNVTDAKIALTFRYKYQVTTMIVYYTGEAYPLCPRCGCTTEREYMNFCSRCGQRLGWHKYRHPHIIYK